MRLAKAYTGRHEIITFTGNYLGQTYGSWSVSAFGGKAREPYGPAMVGVLVLPPRLTIAYPRKSASLGGMMPSSMRAFGTVSK